MELLTEIADDSRLQLLALVGDEYDASQALPENVSVENSHSKDNLQTAEIYNDTVKGYRKIGGRESSFSESIIVS